MNPETNKFEELREESKEEVEKRLGHIYEAWSALYDRVQPLLVRPDGKPFPSHWPIFSIGDRVVVNSYTFKVAHIGERHLLLEPTGPLIVDSERSQAERKKHSKGS